MQETLIGVVFAAFFVLSTAALVGLFGPRKGPRRGPAFRPYL